MVRASQVNKRFGPVEVLKGIDLEVSQGEVMCIIGPSGSGKSTFLRCINHLEQITAGRLWVDGELIGYQQRGDKLHQMRPGAIAAQRRDIGMVFQRFNLFPHKTALENVIEAPCQVKGVSKKDAIAAAEGLLERVGLSDRMKMYPSQLSGGQQQRVGVARALAADPPVMLMDEPFSAVDPIVREQLQDELLALQGELGKTIVFVTHDIDEAIKLGDQVAVLDVGGVLAQMASPDRLLANPASDFVADFVGRDRGFRALGFASEALPLDPVDPALTIRLGDTPRSDGTPWVLVLDEHEAPQGWVEPARIHGPVTREQLHRGGTVTSVDGTLRQALDATLSSPAGLGVVVDADGRLAGTVRPGAVLEAIERARVRAQQSGVAYDSEPVDEPASVLGERA